MCVFQQSTISEMSQEVSRINSRQVTLPPVTHFTTYHYTNHRMLSSILSLSLYLPTPTDDGTATSCHPHRQLQQITSRKESGRIPTATHNQRAPTNTQIEFGTFFNHVYCDPSLCCCCASVYVTMMCDTTGCSMMCGRIKGTDSTINAIWQQLAI